MWRLKSPEGKEVISTMIRPTYDDPLQWSNALASLARNVAAAYSTSDPDKPESDIRYFASDLLQRGVEILTGQRTSSAHGLNSDAEIVMPDDVFEHPDNRQVLNIWGMPATANCPDCETPHEADHFIGVDFDGFTPHHIGEMLAHVVLVSAENSEKNKADRFRVIGEIQEAFFETLNGTVEGRA